MRESSEFLVSSVHSCYKRTAIGTWTNALNFGVGRGEKTIIVQRAKNR